MSSIIVQRVPIEPSQQKNLQALFDSPAWSTLREILSAHCIEAQAEFLDASMYQTEAATDKAAAAKTKAISFNQTLDVLDGIQSNTDEWFRITLEQRR